MCFTFPRSTPPSASKYQWDSSSSSSDTPSQLSTLPKQHRGMMARSRQAFQKWSRAIRRKLRAIPGAWPSSENEVSSNEDRALTNIPPATEYAHPNEKNKTSLVPVELFHKEVKVKLYIPADMTKPVNVSIDFPNGVASNNEKVGQHEEVNPRVNLIDKVRSEDEVTKSPTNVAEVVQGEIEEADESNDEEDETQVVEEDDEDDDDWTPLRDDWERIKQISDDALIQVVLHHVDATNQLSLESCKIIKRTEGTYHYVVIVEVNDKDKYVVKIPCHGSSDRWEIGDAEMLRSEVGTMKLIRDRTNLPLPKVFGFSDTPENQLGAPYILMEALEGRSLGEMWYTEPAGSPNAGKWSEKTQDTPSPALQAMRYKALKSLAQAMAELRKLEFDKIGALHFDEDGNYSVGHSWHMKPSVTKEDMTNKTYLVQRPAFNIAYEFWEHGLDQKFPYDGETEKLRYTLDMFFNAEPLCQSKKTSDSREETFVLMHNDLDIQNVLVNDAGEVTGIIDWDGCMTMPRCIAYAAVPKWLAVDWDADYDFSTHPYLSISLNHYRQVYARAMANILGPDAEDAKYTYKSPIYLSAYNTLFMGNEPEYLIQRMLWEIPGTRCITAEAFINKHYSWDGGHIYFLHTLRAALDPVLPSKAMLEAELKLFPEYFDDDEDYDAIAVEKIQNFVAWL